MVDELDKTGRTSPHGGQDRVFFELPEEGVQNCGDLGLRDVVEAVDGVSERKGSALDLIIYLG